MISKHNLVNLNKLNKGLEGDEILPDVPGLYDKYVEWGIIPEKEKKGGKLISLKAGLIYDTRDNEANPNRGIWSELLVAFPRQLTKTWNRIQNWFLFIDNILRLLKTN